ncbi:hypothetical protein RCF19_29945 [Rhodococcus qingshengii]
MRSSLSSACWSTGALTLSLLIFPVGLLAAGLGWPYGLAAIFILSVGVGHCINRAES